MHQSKTTLNKDLKREVHGLVPILEFRTIPLDDSFNLAIKRIFDIIFSLLVIVFIMSWLTPLLAILIKMESKGPVFSHNKEMVIITKHSIVLNSDQ